MTYYTVPLVVDISSQTGRRFLHNAGLTLIPEYNLHILLE